jgi:predicted nucleotidyltransferase
MQNNGGVREEIDVTTVRGDLAVRLSELIRRRWPAEVQAVGVHGSLAHGDDQDGSDVNLLVVTYRAGSGPQPALRRVDGTLVDLEVVPGEEGLRRARQLTPRWPLEADRFLTTRAPHDPDGWFGRQRDVHLARLAEARPPEITGLARHNWEMASAAHGRAVRLAEWYETDAALVMIAEARLRAALVAGFLTRTYFRNAADAVKRTGVAGAGIQELASVLKTQAEELTARGRPVDGALNALFD